MMSEAEAVEKGAQGWSPSAWKEQELQRKHVDEQGRSTREMCEDCGLVQPTFGFAVEGKKKRWCSGCSKAHAGAVSLQQHCEDCGLKQPTFGLEAEGKKRRWCSGCSKAHDGAVSLDKKRYVAVKK